MRTERLTLPESLQAQLLQFRRHLWTVKTLEAVAGAILGVGVAYLASYALDRLFDTPAWLRGLLLLTAVVGCALVPLAVHRWIYRRRHLDQLARLLTWKHPSIGDQLLGVIELAHSDSEQARSRRLCEAAIAQVAERAQGRDFRDAVPQPRHRHRAITAALAVLACGALWLFSSSAAVNAWQRFLNPWSNTPRYTFAQIEALPQELVVAYGEPFQLGVQLSEAAAWRPATAQLTLPGQPPITARLHEGRYHFDLNGQIDQMPLQLRVGDLSTVVQLDPTLRPELTAVKAAVELPDYLERVEPLVKDVRGGSVTLVKGSRVGFTATANRELTSAQVNGQATQPDGSNIPSPKSAVEGPAKLQFEWRDQFGLSGKEPFQLSVNGRDDEAPSLSSEGLPRQKVVLDSEQLTFSVRAQDDFGVKRVGIEWRGLDETTVSKPAQGERILAAGGSDKESLDLTGTFSAKALGIDPQPLQVRLFVEDYFPGRPRSYSPPFTLYVLSPEDHAIWITEQLNKWHRQSLEVRDRELQLYETNKQLRELTAEELDDPSTRRRLDAQSAAERANGRRLESLVDAGEELVRQATRNPEFGVGHLEKWAEMLQLLKGISDERMPSVADLLKQAADAPQSGQASKGDPSKGQPSAGKPSEGKPSSGDSSGDKPKSGEPQQSNGKGGESKPSEDNRTAGQNRAGGAGSGDQKDPQEEKKTPSVPNIQDVESTQLDPNKDLKKEEEKKSGGGQSKPSLGLPSTNLVGGGKSGDPPPAGQKLDEALAAQQDLLAEFDKISEELNKVLANLEGTTLVKRLKAASRMQNGIAGRLGSTINSAFGTHKPEPKMSMVDANGNVVRPRRNGGLRPTPGPDQAAANPNPSGTAEKPGETPESKPVADPKREQIVKLTSELSQQELKGSQDVSNIMDDMQAYFERRRMTIFKAVLDEMRQQDVVGSLRQLSDDIAKQRGLSIAQCEFWSDTLDRWAEDLVEPSSSGSCPGSKSRGSLPPSIVLEVLKIIEGEMNLREETRVAEQSRAALKKEEYKEQGEKLASDQNDLGVRIDKVAERIRQLPDGPEEFGKELQLLEAVSQVMGEASVILGAPETGPTAIAAETEVIEMLLQSKRFNPNGGGGGGGASPGGGGRGTTSDSALALIGRGKNEREVREDRGTAQTTGETGPKLPEEFRAGLDEYFNRIEGVKRSSNK
ncbi:MAG: hypothetical protein ACKOU6_04020 [Planctomycetota bacterium]